jgi:hypothetical protein
VKIVVEPLQRERLLCEGKHVAHILRKTGQLNAGSVGSVGRVSLPTRL